MTAQPQLVGELIGDQLGPAVDERHLRPADGDPHLRSRCPAPETPIATESPERRPGSSRFEPCDPLVEVVDQLQHRVVERALVGERRLDVPAHQPPQERA